MIESMDKSSTDNDFGDSPAAEIRRRYTYRQLLLRRRVSLPRQVVAGLVGPDCAYHLYRWEKSGPKSDQDESVT